MGVRISSLFTLMGWERGVYLYMFVYWDSITFLGFKIGGELSMGMNSRIG